MRINCSWKGNRRTLVYFGIVLASLALVFYFDLRFPWNAVLLVSGICLAPYVSDLLYPRPIQNRKGETGTQRVTLLQTLKDIVNVLLINGIFYAYYKIAMGLSTPLFLVGLVVLMFVVMVAISGARRLIQNKTKAEHPLEDA